MTFAQGQLVYHVNSPVRRGILTGRTRKMGPITNWEVDYGPGDRTYIPESAIRVVQLQADSQDDRILQGQFGRPDDLRRLMTFEKLKGSLSEFIYSMDAAEIDFLEYQFKPVLKFVESPNERLLLADEVGLGKTIEAALIWVELQARRDARRLLVVCPKMLVSNWRSELRDKFNVPIEQCTIEQLRGHLADLKRIGPQHSFALIATYSSLKPPRGDFDLMDEDTRLSPKGELVRAWLNWEEDYPFADLVIFDEAHSLRNPSAIASRTARALANAAEGLLCASATPINNSNEDLRSILRLLDPGVFENEYLFNALLNQNRPAVELANALAAVPPQLSRAREAVAQLRSSEFVGKSELLPKLQKLLQMTTSKDREHLVEAQRLAEQLNVLGRYVSRTRRRQVSELRAVRHAMVVPVEFSEMEFKFYWAITRLVRDRVDRAGNRFSAFHLVGPQLRMASCIPAMVDAYRQGQLGDFESVLFDAFGADDFGEEDIDSLGKEEEFEDFLKRYREYDFEANDSKYEMLRQVVQKKLPHDKIVIFSFFRGTLAYLRRRLEADGEPVALIHGGIASQEERDAEIRRFERADGPRVLLSSEVGSEGINLQFARVVVNYDLPWNPMRVEQRIGRIDRVGQQAQVLQVIHFKIHGTIEERVYNRLHQKLEIFRSSLGDLEAVIGEEIKKLTEDLFRKHLSPEEEEQRIEQTELVLASRLRAMEELENTGENLLGLSDYIRDRINRNRQLGRFVSPQELRCCFEDFFRRKYLGCTLTWDHPIEGVFLIELTHEAHVALNDFLSAHKQNAIPEQRARIIRGTFHAEISKKRRRIDGQRLVFINHLSPLVRWITEENRITEGVFSDTVALRFREPSMPSGIYVFRVERWLFKGLRKRESLAYAVAHLDGGPVAPPEDAERIVKMLLEKADDWLDRGCDMHQVLERLSFVRDSLSDRMEEAYDTFRAENQTLDLIQQEQVKAHFQLRERQDEQRLQTVIDNRRSERVIKLAKARLEKTRERYRDKMAELSHKAQIDHQLEEIVAGVFINEP